MLSQDNGNKYNTKYCGVGKIALWILDIEYSIEVELGQRITQVGNARYVGSGTRTGGYIEGYISVRKQ